jgi:hypothetical protein
MTAGAELQEAGEHSPPNTKENQVLHQLHFIGARPDHR